MAGAFSFLQNHCTTAAGSPAEAFLALPWLKKKFQAPNSKHQTNSKFKKSNFKVIPYSGKDNFTTTLWLLMTT
jgi:hypothetical protein